MVFQWKNIVRVLFGFFLLYLAIYYWSSVSKLFGLLAGGLAPIFAGVGIAYVLNILMSFFEKHYFPKHYDKPIVVKTRPMVCVIATFVSFFAIIFIVVRMIVPELVDCIQKLISDIPELLDSWSDEILSNESLKAYLPQDTVEMLGKMDLNDWQDVVINFVGPFLDSAGIGAGAIVDVAMSVVSSVITIFISIVFSAYFLLSRNNLKYQTTRLLHVYAPKYERKTLYVFSVFNESFRKFIVGQIIEAVILGVLCVVGMMIFKFPYPQMIGVFIGFTSLVPVAGAYIGGAVGAIIILTVSPIQALFFILFIIVLQQIEGNFIYPKVVGNSIGLPAVWVLISITVGGALFGIIGMLLGVPVFAAIYRLIRENVFKREFEEAALKPSVSNVESDKKS